MCVCVYVCVCVRALVVSPRMCGRVSVLSYKSDNLAPHHPPPPPPPPPPPVTTKTITIAII